MEEMEAACKKNQTWEEKIYWSHFSTIHFSQFLLSGFKEQLAIPDKFAKNLKDKLSATVTLRGPSGITWNVGLMTEDDTLSFKFGWEEFVCDNALEENDFLVFRYKGQSQFDVLMFDSSSLCEKEAAYFVKGHGHMKNLTGVKKEDCVTATTNDGGSRPVEVTKEDNGLAEPSEQRVSPEMTLKEFQRKHGRSPNIAEC